MKIILSACPAIPSLASFNHTELPDPFTFLNGDKVLTLSDWACRREEISTLLQEDELGILPGPPESMTVSFSGKTLTITVTEAGKSITFAPTITYPTTGTAPFPAIIGMGGISIPSPAGVAIINFNNAQIAAQDTAASRGQGLFYNLFGSDASAGLIISRSHLGQALILPLSALAAWAWTVRVIMDALEQTPAARINAARVGVSGCSRNGKGALVAGIASPMSF